MGELSFEFYLQIVIYIITLAFFAGVIWVRLRYIEKKQDKHNKLIERMYVVEESTNLAHHRIDEINNSLE